jgi:hypothetical protein
MKLALMAEGNKPKGPPIPGDSFRGAVATNYLAERIHKPIWQLEQHAMRRLLSSLPDGLSVLDVPFGTGRFAEL